MRSSTSYLKVQQKVNSAAAVSVIREYYSFLFSSFIFKGLVGNFLL